MPASSDTTWEQHRTLGQQAAKREEYERALQHFLEAGTKLSQQMEPDAPELRQKVESMAALQFNIGQLCARLAATRDEPSFFDRALHFLQQAERSAASVESKTLPHILNAEGDVYFQKDDLAQAVACYESALQLGPEASPQEQSVWHHNLALTHCILGAHEAMLSHMEQSLKLLVSVEAFGEMALQLANLAALVETTGEVELALKLYVRAYQLAQLWSDRDEELYATLEAHIERLSEAV